MHACIQFSKTFIQLKSRNPSSFSVCGFYFASAAKLHLAERVHICIFQSKWKTEKPKRQTRCRKRRENPLTLTSQIASTHIWTRIYVWCLCNASRTFSTLFSRCMFLMCTWKTHRLILIYMQLPLWKNSYSAKAHKTVPCDGYFCLPHPLSTLFHNIRRGSKCHRENACICIFILSSAGLGL